MNNSWKVIKHLTAPRKLKLVIQWLANVNQCSCFCFRLQFLKSCLKSCRALEVSWWQNVKMWKLTPLYEIKDGLCQHSCTYMCKIRQWKKRQMHVNGTSQVSFQIWWHFLPLFDIKHVLLVDVRDESCMNAIWQPVLVELGRGWLRVWLGYIDP